MASAALLLAACGGLISAAPGADPSASASTASARSASPASASASPFGSISPSTLDSPLPSALDSPLPSALDSPSPSALTSPLPSPSIDPLGATLPFDDATAAKLQKVLDHARARIPTPGISVAIRLADGRTWLGVSGHRRLSPARPVDQDTVFSIASITKTFVTAVVMQLVAEGKLHLDDHLSRYLPDYPRARHITMRQLLAHTSGIANYFESGAYSRAVFAHPGRRWTVPDILALVGTPYCDPGRCFHYSNTNFVLLGQVVERVTHKPLARVIRQRLLDPLGLSHTWFQPDEPTPRDAAHGHLWGGGTTFMDQTGSAHVLPNMSAATAADAAGAMASNPADLARWALALYATDRVVRPDLLAQMLDFRKRDEYGLGTRTRIFNGRRAVGHGGSLRGYEDGVWYFPREGAVIVLLSNRGLYNPDRTIRELAKTLWKHIDVPAPEYRRSRNTD
jgi:D-alanyl-D-alanine carboxypeptidase